jgi:hypothetical protein
VDADTAGEPLGVAPAVWEAVDASVAERLSARDGLLVTCGDAVAVVAAVGLDVCGAELE